MNALNIFDEGHSNITKTFYDLIIVLCLSLGVLTFVVFQQINFDIEYISTPPAEMSYLSLPKVFTSMVEKTVIITITAQYFKMTLPMTPSIVAITTAVEEVNKMEKDNSLILYNKDADNISK
jgi:hypothetical protein